MDLSNKQNRNTLRGFFEAGDIPTENHFRSLIEGMLNHAEDKIAKVGTNPVSIEAEGAGDTDQNILDLYRNFSQENPNWSLSLNPISTFKADQRNAGLDISDAKGRSRLFIDEDNGKVGIGTTVPSAKLSVVANGNALHLASDRENGHVFLAFFADGESEDRHAYIGYPTNGSDEFRINNDRGGDLSFRTNDHVLLFMGGGLGIGPTNPVSKLHITHNGASANGVVALLDQNVVGNSDGPKIGFAKRVKSTASKYWTAGVLNGVNVDDFAISEDGRVGTFGSPRLVVAAGGNVGIGTTTPVARLQIEGGPDIGLSGARGFLIMGNPNASHMAMDNNEIMAKSNATTAATLFLQADGGSVRIGNTASLGFGNQVRQMLNLWSTSYALGVQSSTLYFRSGSQFCWYRGGSHNDGINNPGGGTRLMRLLSNGNLRITGPISASSGADFAEYFQSKSGKEIAPGITVVLEKGLIRPAKKGETPIGAISATPALIGNDIEDFETMYVKDDYGRTQMEEYEVEEEIMESSAGDTPKTQKVKQKRPKVNPNYKEDAPFVTREESPEWNLVGIVGQVRINKGQPIAAGWVKIRDISDKVELWLVK